MTPADRLFYTYNGTDCCCTYECSQAMDAKLMPGQRGHYQFNLDLLAPLLFMELRGIRYDYEKAKAKLKRVQRWAYVLQDMLNRAAGQCLPANEEGWIALLASSLCLAKPRRRAQVTTTRTFKNGKTKTTSKLVSTPATITTLADCREFVLGSKACEMRRVLSLLKRGSLLASYRGELSELLNVHVKVNSTGPNGDACRFLYETCGFPKQYQKEGNRLTDRLASDDEACIKIWVGEQKKPSPLRCQSVALKSQSRLALVFLKLRRLITQTKTLRVAPDADGRMRCGYNVVGTETARLTCYESPTGSGYNLQTVTKNHRDLFLADPGCLLAQCDLAGADGWTVAAYAAAQGDNTMLEDYKAKLKPAQIGVLMWQQGPQINKLSREELKPLCKAITEETTQWEYFAFKRVQHMSSYKGGHITMSNQILTDSVKKGLEKGGGGQPVVVSSATCEQIQKTCFFARYWGIPRWHQWMEREIKSNGQLIAANGFIRRFFGRKDDYDTVKQALAHLPQAYTTYSTLLALRNMWVDPENRKEDNSLWVEPLHTVHDSIVAQFSADRKSKSITKFTQWFNNELRIAQEFIVIPYEIGIGADWKNVKAP